jgi:hypothetical protein
VCGDNWRRLRHAGPANPVCEQRARAPVSTELPQELAGNALAVSYTAHAGEENRYKILCIIECSHRFAEASLIPSTTRQPRWAYPRPFRLQALAPGGIACA